ncbi:hypothetical protein E4T52_10223 [Aureobasidium sp. EXF-3400]|nr:hypothetical protein E4T51_09270 [Aureobasidium sp. EXF-12344]KAI4774808.1 hypothetical protein E4T52_10223 [Aureobasidium sp. EXF-3400]
MSTDASSSTRPKRQLVKAACQSCQKRKVKCSGERPMCMLCQQRGQSCVYDSEAGISRVEAVRRRNKELGERNADYELVFNALHSTPEPEAFDHLRRLRECPDMETYARTLRRSRPPTRKRPSDQLNDLMDDGTLSNLSPVSVQSQDQQDGDSHIYTDPLRIADYTNHAQQPAMMIDPRLGQHTLYSFPGSNGSTLQSLAEIWPFQESSNVRQESFQPNVHDWTKPQSQAGPPQNHYLYDVQMPQSSWVDGNVDPRTGQPMSQSQSRFEG